MEIINGLKTMTITGKTGFIDLNNINYKDYDHFVIKLCGDLIIVLKNITEKYMKCVIVRDPCTYENFYDKLKIYAYEGQTINQTNMIKCKDFSLTEFRVDFLPEGLSQSDRIGTNWTTETFNDNSRDIHNSYENLK